MRKQKGEKVTVRVSKSIFSRKSSKIFIVILVIFALVSYPLLRIKKSSAEEAYFYPTACQGNWLNAQSVAGEPMIDGLTNETAQATGGGQKLICSNFVGELPETAIITKTELEFIWSTTPPANNNIEPTIEESFDISPLDNSLESDQILPEENNNIENNEEPINEVNKEEEQVDNYLNETILPMEGHIIENQTAPEVQPVPEVLPPTSWLRYWLFLPAKAQEETQAVLLPNLDNQSSDNLPEQTLEKNNENLTIDSEFSPQGEIESEKILDEEIGGTISGVASPEVIFPQEENTTALFDLSYSVDDEEVFIDSLNQNNLNQRYTVDLAKDRISQFKIYLTSRFTIDEIDNLFLEGVKLVITYEEGVKEVLSNEPDLDKDSLIEEAIDDFYWVIEIAKFETGQREIWYTDARFKNNQLLDQEKSVNQTMIIDNEITPTVEPFTQKEEGIIGPVLVEEEAEKPVWNLVAKDELINEFSPLGYDSQHIFWISKESDQIYFYNILNLNLDSAPYAPEEGRDFVIYRDKGDVAHKATLNFTEHIFTFEPATEEESILEPVKMKKLLTRNFEKDIIIDSLATHYCHVEDFSLNISEISQAKVSLNLIKDNNYSYELEVGGLPVGINVVFADNENYNYGPRAEQDSVILTVTRQNGAQTGNFTVPIVFIKKDIVNSSTVCQFNIINL